VTTYSKREVVTRRVEYGIESGQPTDVFLKVYAIARRDYEERSGITEIWDDWAKIYARDDEIVIAFDVEAVTL